ncbi:tail assembly protein [Vibrio phage 033B]|nr:tail assembly protein [Vibrio phage 033B]
MGGSKKQTVGYRYSLGLHKALCHGPIDKVLKIRVDEKVAWEGDNDGSTGIYIDKPSLFGGDPPEGEGGVRGWVDVEFGGPNQGPNSYLQSVLGALIPAFRGVCCAVLRRPMIGNSPYLKNWGWTLQRIMTTGSQGEAQWYPTKAKIGEFDMNPAHIVRECITNIDWGMGTDVSAINNANFQSVADTLFDEGFGLSVMWDRQKPLNEFLTDIMKHIDGVLYVNRTNGLFEINLIRDGYDASTIPVLDESEIIEVTDYTRPLVGDLTSQVTVQYWDRETMADASITVQDIALSRQQGAAIATTVQYPAITDPDLANRVAMRDLKTVSTPLIGCTIKCNRRIAEGLIMGSVFKMSWPRLAIEEVIMRVVEIDYGTEVNPEITINIVQDIFGLGDAVYAPTPPTEWEPPVSTPTPPPARLYAPAPYRELVQILGQAEAEALDPTDEYLMATAAKPSNDSMSVEWWNDTGSGGELTFKADIDFSPYGLTNADLGFLEDTVQLTVSRDLELIAAGTLAGINDELIRIDGVNVNDGILTISRGVADTLPQEHAAGSVIFAFDEFADTELLRYTASDRIRSQMLTKTIQGVLDPADAPVDVTDMFARQAKPYSASNIQLNGEYYPITFMADIALTWAHRDRILQADILYDFTAGSIGPENGTTYTIQIFGDGSILKTFAGETGTSVTYTVAEEIADHGDLSTNYRFEITTERNGETALHKFVMEVERDIPLEITLHPSSETVPVGNTATFTSDAIGWDRVQWEQRADSGSPWGDVVGATDQSYTTPPTVEADNGKQFRAMYYQGLDSLPTNEATLTVLVEPPLPYTMNIGNAAGSQYGYREGSYGTFTPRQIGTWGLLENMYTANGADLIVSTVDNSQWDPNKPLYVVLSDGMETHHISGLFQTTNYALNSIGTFGASGIISWLRDRNGTDVGVDVVNEPPLGAGVHRLTLERSGNYVGAYGASSTTTPYTYGHIEPRVYPNNQLIFSCEVQTADDRFAFYPAMNGDQAYNGWNTCVFTFDDGTSNVSVTAALEDVGGGTMGYRVVDSTLRAWMENRVGQTVTLTITEAIFGEVLLGSYSNDYYGLATDIGSHTGSVVSGCIWPDGTSGEITHFYEDNTAISRFGFYSSTPPFNGWNYLDITTVAPDGSSITIPWWRSGNAYVTVNNLEWRNWARTYDGQVVKVTVKEGTPP